MESIQVRVIALLMSLMMSLVSIPASAEEGMYDSLTSDRPSAGAMVADAMVARPVLLGLTALGTVLFVATLPFSLLGGNVGEAGKMLVVGPAKSTFLRCLGCTAAQNESKNQQMAKTN